MIYASYGHFLKLMSSFSREISRECPLHVSGKSTRIDVCELPTALANILPPELSVRCIHSTRPHDQHNTTQ